MLNIFFSLFLFGMLITLCIRVFTKAVKLQQPSPWAVFWHSMPGLVPFITPSFSFKLNMTDMTAKPASLDAGFFITS